MPLYLPEGAIPSDLPPEFQQALQQIQSEVAGEPVNPARALQLIDSRLRALLPEVLHPLLQVQGQPSWNKLHSLYPRLVFSSNQGKDKALLAAASLVRAVVSYSTSPPRVLEIAPWVEVSSFTRMCGYLRLPFAVPLVEWEEDHQVQLHDFCRYCWLPALSRGVCVFHSANGGRHPGGSDLPVCASAPYKALQRLRPDFDAQVLSLASSEEMEFHESGFSAPVLMPAQGSGLRQWLATRRPRLCEVLKPPDPSHDFTARSDLLTALYGPWASAVDAAIGPGLDVLTPVTLRAEAWLKAWNDRAKHGGARSKEKCPDQPLPFVINAGPWRFNKWPWVLPVVSISSTKSELLAAFLSESRQQEPSPSDHSGAPPA